MLANNIDSITAMKGDTLHKYAPAHPLSGTPTYSILSGAGTSPTVTVTGNDLRGSIQIVTGASGTFGVLSGTLLFANNFTYQVFGIAGANSLNTANLGVYMLSGYLASQVQIGTGITLAANTTYVFNYIMAP